ncbi:MAG TPA: L-histidine N(alpha)-methyltransferase [Geobacteraceae bacterium]
MKADFRALKPEDTGRSATDRFARDVLDGLSMEPKETRPVWLYDERGSALYQQITETEDYYLTRCEREILAEHGPDLAARLGRRPFNLVDLGAGDGRKTALLLRSLLDQGVPFTYVPVDISVEAMRQLTGSLTREFDRTALEVKGLIADYFDALRWVKRTEGAGTVVLFLGSNIGNFDAIQGQAFLRSLRSALHEGDRLLIGSDLKKDPRVIERAYDDKGGITRKFNLNLLERMNRELGADFDPGRFVYRSYYDVRRGAVESWLISTRAQQVHVGALGRRFSFREWEGIHTESSRKYSRDEIGRMAAEAGFTVEGDFMDGRGYFVDSLWRAR